MKINENTLAKQIAQKEGKKVEVNIAQIKEVLSIALGILANDHKMSEVVDLMERKFWG